MKRTTLNYTVINDEQKYILENCLENLRRIYKNKYGEDHTFSWGCSLVWYLDGSKEKAEIDARFVDTQKINEVELLELRFLKPKDLIKKVIRELDINEKNIGNIFKEIKDDIAMEKLDDYDDDDY